MHRIAHWLYEAELFFLARFVNHLARLLTGIDIHPGARIGKHLFIDHGFSVIGETAIIGNNVTIYQCVTLGGTDPANGVPGKRHPTLEDGVIVGSGAQILGPITVASRARIGANAVVTKDVPPRSLVIGVPAKLLRQLSAEEAAALIDHAQKYHRLALAHAGRGTDLGFVAQPPQLGPT
ncbi:MAG: serine acetyltransferase [Sphingopyxis sp.]|nr:serine acetyltransferase [Sphingopyxis sp.]